MISDEEVEKFLQQFETIEPSGGTDREIIEMARKHNPELPEARARKYRFRLLVAAVLLASTGVALFFVLNSAAPTGQDGTVPFDLSFENAKPVPFEEDRVEMPELSEEMAGLAGRMQPEEPLAELERESEEPAPREADATARDGTATRDIFAKNSGLAAVVIDTVGGPARNGEPLKRGDTLESGATVETGAGGMCHILGRDGSIFKLNTNTKVCFTNLGENRNAVLLDGEIWVDAAPVSTEQPNSLIIKTPNAKATVLGTVFSLKATPLRTLLSVQHGSVTLAALGGIATIGATEQCLVAGGRAPVIAPLIHMSDRFRWTKTLSAEGQHPVEKARSAANVESSDSSVGSLVAKSASGWQPLSLRRMNVTVVIEGGLARTTVDQVFYNSSSRQLEGRFKFPLPKDSSICRFAMTVDTNELMEGSIVERTYARKIYESIVSRKRDPGLLEWQYGSTFSARIFPIFPRSEKRIIIGYTQPVSTFAGRSTYTFPMVSSLMAKMPPENFKLVLKLKTASDIMTLDCPSHYVASAVDSSKCVRIGFTARDYSARNNFILSWVEDAKGLGVIQSSGPKGYTMLRLRPDLSKYPARRPEKVVLLLDTSASTAPNEREIIYNIVEKILATLGPGQEFMIGFVDVSTRFLSDSFEKATPQNMEWALADVWTADCAGATNLEKCAGKLASVLKKNSDATVVYVGDGQPTMGETGIAELTGIFKAGLGGRVRNFHTVGIGSNVNEGVMRAICGALRGTYTALRPGDDLLVKVFRLCKTIQMPILTDAKLLVTGGILDKTYPAEIPPIPARGECVLITRYAEKGEISATLKGKVGEKEYEQNLTFTTGAGGAPSHVLGRIWAQRRIADLLSTDKEGCNKDEIISLSKAFSLVTPYTSFLVLESEQEYSQYNIERQSQTKKPAFADNVELPTEKEERFAEKPANDLDKLRDMGIPVNRLRRSDWAHRPSNRLSKDLPAIVTQREFAEQEYDETLKRAMFKTPRIEAEKMVERPIILLEEEVEITKDIPRGTSFDNLSNKNLDSTSAIDAYGIGGGRAGAYGQRWGKGSLAREGGSPGTESAVTAALRWLHFHQDKNGQWNQDEFQKNCDTRKSAACDGQGTSHYDVAVTSLSLLSFIGNGHTHRVGLFKKTVKRGLDWLVGQQQDDGSFGPRLAESWIYNHAIATMALCEAYAVTRDYRLQKPAQKAVDFIISAQNPGLGWKYEPQSGRSDTSVTGWMVLALKAAKTAGLKVEQKAFDGAINWFDRATNTAGKCGYMRPGDDGSTIRGVNDRFAKLPTMTAISVICRIFCGQSRRDPKILKGIDILTANLPYWNKPKNDNVDMYYWYYSTCAMFQYGGQKWHKWNTAMKKALLDTQRVGGCADGSWDPVGKWGMVGGRVYATAISCLTLEVYYRYARANPGAHSTRDMWSNRGTGGGSSDWRPKTPAPRRRSVKPRPAPAPPARESSEVRMPGSTGPVFQAGDRPAPLSAYQELLGGRNLDRLVEKAGKDPKGEEARLLARLFEASPRFGTPLDERLKISRQKDIILIALSGIWPFDDRYAVKLVTLAMKRFEKDEVLMLLGDKADGRSRLNCLIHAAKTKPGGDAARILASLIDPAKDRTGSAAQDKKLLKLKRRIYEVLVQVQKGRQDYINALLGVLQSLGERDKIVRLLTSSIDTSPEDENVRVQCANALKTAGFYAEACEQYEEASRIRPESINYYLEAARCADRMGYKNFKKAEKLYMKILKLNLSREDINITEAKRKLRELYRREASRARSTGDSTAVAEFERKIGKLRTDSLVFRELRIVLRWDTDQTDVDLWVTAPGHQKCFYKQQQTLAGGKLDRDDTDGYGPETFTLSNLIPGKYVVKAHYFSGNVRTSGTVEIITREGTEREKRNTYKFKLDRSHDKVTVFEGNLK